MFLNGAESSLSPFIWTLVVRFEKKSRNPNGERDWKALKGAYGCFPAKPSSFPGHVWQEVVQHSPHCLNNTGYEAV